MTESAKPRANSISVPDGRNEQIFMLSLLLCTKHQRRTSIGSELAGSSLRVVHMPRSIKLINSEQDSGKEEGADHNRASESWRRRSGCRGSLSCAAQSRVR